MVDEIIDLEQYESRDEAIYGVTDYLEPGNSAVLVGQDHEMIGLESEIALQKRAIKKNIVNDLSNMPPGILEFLLPRYKVLRQEQEDLTRINYTDTWTSP